jgi:hypothetical protein
VFEGIIEKRIDRLINKRGLLRFEAKALCTVSTSNPYFESMLKKRQRLYEKAVKKGWSKKAYIDYIKNEYEENNWYKITVSGSKILDPWAMFRSFEDKHKQKRPEYTSPWVRKQVNKDLLKLDREKAKKFKDYKRRES